MINEKQNKEAVDLIKKSKNFILLCHESPDIDSVLSCLILKRVLTQMKKKADIISVDQVGARIKFLHLNGDIKVTDVNKFDYSNYDVLFVLDANNLGRLGIIQPINFKGKIVNIDHHEGVGVGDIHIQNTKAGSTCTLIYYLLKKWGVNVDKETLNIILAGILSDTEIFQFSIYSSSFIFNTVSELIDKGADYETALFYVDQYYDIEVFKYWAEAIQRIKKDTSHKFAYTIIPFKVQKQYEKYGISSRQISDKFLRKIRGTNFGIVIVEEEENGSAKVSIRTRTPGYYVLDLVKRLGGGGHLTGGGAVVKTGSFEESCKLILDEAKEYARFQNE